MANVGVHSCITTTSSELLYSVCSSSTKFFFFFFICNNIDTQGSSYLVASSLLYFRRKIDLKCDSGNGLRIRVTYNLSNRLNLKIMTGILHAGFPGPPACRLRKNWQRRFAAVLACNVRTHLLQVLILPPIRKDTSPISSSWGKSSLVQIRAMPCFRIILEFCTY